MVNSIKTAGTTSIATSARDNSDFEGYLKFAGATDTYIAPPTTCTAYIKRLIKESEQTDEEGTIERIENGRSIKGSYYQRDGTGVNFTVELTGAYSNVSAVGIILASFVTLLAF